MGNPMKATSCRKWLFSLAGYGDECFRWCVDVSLLIWAGLCWAATQLAAQMQQDQGEAFASELVEICGISCHVFASFASKVCLFVVLETWQNLRNLLGLLAFAIFGF